VQRNKSRGFWCQPPLGCGHGCILPDLAAACSKQGLDFLPIYNSGQGSDQHLQELETGWLIPRGAGRILLTQRLVYDHFGNVLILLNVPRVVGKRSWAARPARCWSQLPAHG